jgi:hypothetical protein
VTDLRPRGSGGTPLCLPPYVSQQAAPDERAPKSDDAPVSHEAASGGRIPAPHARLGRERSARAAWLDAEVPETLREPGRRRVPQLSCTRLDQSARGRPEAPHDPEDELFVWGFSKHREGDRSSRALTGAGGSWSTPAAQGRREPGGAGTEPHKETDRPWATEVRVTSHLVDASWSRGDPDRVPRSDVVRWNDLVEKRAPLRCWLVPA